MNKKILLGILAITLVFGMSVTSCGDKGSGDPIDVNLNLPSIKELPSYAGTTATQTEAEDLVQEAITAITDEVLGEITSGIGESVPFSVKNLSRSAARAAQREEINEILEKQTIYPGVTATGFAVGYVESDETNGNMAADIKLKYGIDFNNAKVSNDTITVTGKNYYDAKMYMKMAVANNYNYNIKIDLGFGNGYAFSLSQGGKGIKCLMDLQISYNDSFSASSSMDNISEDDILKKIKASLTVEYYDNSNKKQSYSVKLNNINEIMNYTGLNYSDYL